MWMWSPGLASILSSFLWLGQARKVAPHYQNTSHSHSSSPLHCCPGPLTLSGSGAAADKWSKYLGQYKPTGEQHEGAEVFRNKNGNYLYHHKRGQWRTNNVINDRGVLKGVNRGKGECVSPDSKWYYWDKKWRRGKIEVSCDHDSGAIEQGRSKVEVTIILVNVMTIDNVINTSIYRH